MAGFDHERWIADMCISRIPERIRQAQRFGKLRIDICAFTRFEYKRPEGNTDYDFCDFKWLWGAPKYVYEYCEKKGFKPAIEPYDKPVSPGNEPKRAFSITIEVPPESPKDEEPKTK